MATPPNFRISPGIPPGSSDLFLPIFANIFLRTIVVIIKVSPRLANFLLLLLLLLLLLFVAAAVAAAPAAATVVSKQLCIQKYEPVSSNNLHHEIFFYCTLCSTN